MKQADIKETMYAFKPETFVFVISVDKNGKPNGMVAGWNTKCSSSPPMFAVSIWKKGNTHKLIRESKEFVIAVPNKELEKEVLFFGSTHGNEVDKFKETGIETEKAKFVKSPLIKKATMNFECKLIKECEAGSHIIFIGEIVAAYHNKDKKITLNIGKVDGKRVFKDF